jgi:hypothetical protein
MSKPILTPTEQAVVRALVAALVREIRQEQAEQPTKATEGAA